MRPQTADRRPQTADRRPQTAFLLIRYFSIALITAIATFATPSSFAQTCANDEVRNVSGTGCYNACPLGGFYHLDVPQAGFPCINALGDGLRIHANRPYTPMPSIRFSYHVDDNTDCTTERAGRIGIVPPLTFTGGPLSTDVYPISSGNFQEADVFLVSTCLAKDLLLSTNNADSRIKFLTTPTLGTQAERMTILNNGNVGIGMAAPTRALQVINEVAVGEAIGSSTYIANKRGIITIYPSNNNNQYHIDNNRGDAGSLNFSVGGLPGGGSGDGFGDIMSLHGNGGRMRVGCTWSTGFLPKIDARLVVSEDPVTNGSSFPYRNSVILRLERRNDVTYSAANPYTLISAGDNTNETFVVKSNGKVEIGSGTGTAGRRIPGTVSHTLDDNYLLSVDGKIVSRESVILASGDWSDYVFNEDYNLASLEEVEHQIKTEKHLADVPSAADVEKHGINLGEMQATLLKKIEELTLYMIKMNKENNELRAEVNTLKSLITTTK